LRDPGIAGGVADGQQGAMLEARYATEKVPDLSRTENEGQFLRFLGGGDDVFDAPILVKRDFVRDLSQVRGLGMRRKIAYLHVFGHALTKGRHGKLLCEMECAASSVSIFSQKGSRRKGCQAGLRLLHLRTLRAGS
jgi:hypothetical protein